MYGSVVVDEGELGRKIGERNVQSGEKNEQKLIKVPKKFEGFWYFWTIVFKRKDNFLVR